MDLFSDLITAVQSDLTIGDESTLYPLTTVKLAINRSYRKVAGLFDWPETEDAKKTSTVAGQEYYDYPTTWRPDSVWRLEVDDELYGETPDGSPLDYADYLTWRGDDANANSTAKKWASQHRRYFIYPIPTTNGSNNITVWGRKVPDALSSNGDVTIFSHSMPECNEAVVLEAVAILKSKGEDRKGGDFLSVEAKQILVTAWTKIARAQAKYEKNQPFFEVTDMFGRGRSSDIIGNFE
jgi:hypothetical protein